MLCARGNKDDVPFLKGFCLALDFRNNLALQHQQDLLALFMRLRPRAAALASLEGHHRRLRALAGLKHGKPIGRGAKVFDIHPR